MARLQHKSVTKPDEVRPYPLGQNELFEMDDFVVGRMVHEPGWQWSNNVRPIAGTDRCKYHHLGYCVSGRLQVTLRDGPRRRSVRPRCSRSRPATMRA